MNKGFLFLFLIIFIAILSACSPEQDSEEINKVGLLVPETISDQVWGTKGYKGLLKIQSQHDIEVYYEEEMNSEAATLNAIMRFDEQGVNLIFGHGSEYGEYFNKIGLEYPHIHFVSFNSHSKLENTTSLSFESYAMGYFGGMTAAHMSNTGSVGIIAAFDWQPEVNGFIEGVQFQNPEAQVFVRFTEDWDDKEKAHDFLTELMSQKVDVLYPAGDGYNISVIETLKENGLFAIGYVSDQSDLGENTVLTSTVQHVDRLYEVVADQFIQGKLESGDLYFDFQDDVISLGRFSSNVDEEFQEKIRSYVEEYKKSGVLPEYQEVQS
ncbi:BMP family ABC transporter substrate-binding protein [Bacillus sp. 2205SS5-2]|uniref:BMP family ABC transporter substrate-binding protein n=1 Tax=Bacillus sp. 2205SS5-2 TaxID=3109031 RepID=UPI003004B674